MTRFERLVALVEALEEDGRYDNGSTVNEYHADERRLYTIGYDRASGDAIFVHRAGTMRRHYRPNIPA
jgi:hypothetical protein